MFSFNCFYLKGSSLVFTLKSVPSPRLNEVINYEKYVYLKEPKYDFIIISYVIDDLNVAELVEIFYFFQKINSFSAWI